MGKNPYGVTSVDAISIIVPHSDTENTDTLVNLSKNFGTSLGKALRHEGVDLKHRTIFSGLFNPNKDLPTNALLYFTLLPDKKLANALIGILSAKRFHLLHIFSGLHPKGDWIEEEVIAPNDILLTKNDRAGIAINGLEEPLQKDQSEFH